MSSGKFEEDHIPIPGLALPESYAVGFPPIEADDSEEINYQETANLLRIEVAELLNSCGALVGNLGKAAFYAELGEPGGSVKMVDQKLRVVVMALGEGKGRPSIQIVTNEYLPPAPNGQFPVKIGVFVINPDGGLSNSTTGIFHGSSTFIYERGEPYGPLLNFCDNGHIMIHSSTPAPYYAPGPSTWFSYQEMIDVLDGQRGFIARLRPDMLVSSRESSWNTYS